MNHIASESTHSTYCWTIDNKYYNASVHIVVLHAKHASVYTEPETLAAVNKFIPSLNALVILFDSSKVCSLIEILFCGMFSFRFCFHF